jgi:hypothetical protein
MAEMDKIPKYRVKDTKAIVDRTKYAALIRAILDFTPYDLKGFITCTLRYTLTLNEGVVTKCSETLSHSVATEGYHDDDYAPSVGPPRLGNTGIMGKPDQKQTFERLIKPWFEFVVLGLERSQTGFAELRKKTDKAFKVARTFNDPRKPEQLVMLNEVLSVLVPDTPLKAQRELSMKVDVYTDRTQYGWHKDWNDGHALVVGLLNVSENSLSSAELVFLEGDLTEDQFIQQGVNRPSSPTRTAMRALVHALNPAEHFIEKSDHKSGQIRWFNDVVWVHRTPPMNNKQVNNATFGIGAGFGTLPPFVRAPEKAGHPTRYVPADVGRRMLLRVTIRDIYQPCTEVWYQRTEKLADRQMWFRVKGEKATQWKVSTGGGWYPIPADWLTTHQLRPTDPHTGDSYSLQCCDANRFFPYCRDYWINNPTHPYVFLQFKYTDTNQVEHPVHSVAVAKDDMWPTII